MKFLFFNSKKATAQPAPRNPKPISETIAEQLAASFLKQTQIAEREPKPTMTIMDACKQAFEEMPEQFAATRFINRARFISETRAFDSTILRDLRRLRARYPKTCMWVCIDNKKAIYQKINNNQS